jgi:outer membrane lipoprotein
MKLLKKSVSVLLFFFFTSGCLAPISKEIQSTADDETLFEEIFENPDEHKGKIVILGGEIQQLRKMESRTEVEFAEVPLYNWDRPALGFEPGEHFFVLFPERLDEFLYRKGKVMTVAGRVIGRRTLRGYDYPLLAYEQSYVWDKLREDRFPSFGAFVGMFD